MEPGKTKKVISVPRKDSDQSRHPSSLSVFAGFAQWVVMTESFFKWIATSLIRLDEY